MNQASNQVEYVSTTQHSSVVTYPRSQVRFDGSHPKVVYHKDGASTHFIRLANGNDEPPETITTTGVILRWWTGTLAQYLAA
ncbi:NPP1 family protein [Streptosporangium vulgare]|uniref:NPP1 family protein n=1 Tax=Streptosporangium vulgare TaxID=46190 RepID=UPI0033891A98